jgi:hypothetical protein
MYRNRCLDRRKRDLDGRRFRAGREQVPRQKQHEQT